MLDIPSIVKLKFNARKQLRTIYWPSLLVCLVSILLGGYYIGSLGRLTLFEILDNSVSGGFFVSIYYYIAIFILFSFFISGPIAIGCARYFLRSITNEQKFTDIFVAFRTKRYMVIASIVALTQIIIIAVIIPGVFLASIQDINAIMVTILFILPAILSLAYSYRLISYVVAQNPNIGVREALRTSWKLASGNRWKLLKLDLSFGGMYILAALVFGVGIFFVIPYH